MTLAKSLPRIHLLEMELLMKDIRTLAKSLLRISPVPTAAQSELPVKDLRTSGESFSRIPLPPELELLMGDFGTLAES